jgi:hypothetical protein
MTRDAVDETHALVQNAQKCQNDKTSQNENNMKNDSERTE